MSANKIIANRIKQKALGALQEADEIGGPDYPEYIALMEEMSAECLKRASRARANQREWKRADCLAWFQKTINAKASIVATGGGCDGIHIPLADGEAHWLITDDANAPESLSKPMVAGVYDSEGEHWATFDCRNALHCADIIKAMTHYTL